MPDNGGILVKQQRPVACYACGRILGTVSTTLDPDGMKHFRTEAKRLREAHQCQKATAANV